MSCIFGSLAQQGYVVREIQGALRHWLSRGAEGRA